MTAQKMAPPPHEPAQPGRSRVWDFFVWLVQFSITILLIGAMIMALVNVFGSGIEVDGLAEQSACRGQPAGCEAVIMQWERTPFAHTTQVSTTGGTKVVKCQREHILYGAWGCTATNKVLPALPPSIPPASATPRDRTIIIAIPASAQARPAKPAPSAEPRAAGSR